MIELVANFIRTAEGLCPNGVSLEESVRTMLELARSFAEMEAIGGAAPMLGPGRKQ